MHGDVRDSVSAAIHPESVDTRPVLRGKRAVAEYRRHREDRFTLRAQQLLIVAPLLQNRTT